jgi:glycosyltransferase involved in cell wall biosynthesis
MDTYSLGLNLFTTSHWVEQSLFGVEYIGIGFRAENFSPRKKERRVMTIGRKQQIKGFSYLVEMSQRLTKELAMPMLITSLDKSIDLGGMTALKAGLSDQQLAAEYGKSMYYICTSQHEGFGLPILEAMASGCVVVTTACDGPEGNFCVNEENCLIVSKDEPREMVAAIRKLDTDSGLRDKLIKGALATSKQWGWQPVFTRLDSYLTRTIS